MDGQTNPPVTDPPPAPTPPADPPATPPRPVVVNSGPDFSSYFTELGNKLAALPESVANAVREATPQPPPAPTPPATPPATGTSQLPANAGDQQTGGNTMPTKRSFGEWFLGVKK